VAGLALGVALLVLSAPHVGWLVAIVEQSVGWLFIGAGLLAWAARPLNRSWALLVATGFAWIVGNGSEQVKSPLLFTITSPLNYVWVGFLVHLVLAFPEGRLRTRRDRIAVAAGYVASCLFAPALRLFWDPRDVGCGSCPAHLNGLASGRAPGLVHVLSLFLSAVFFLYALALFANMAQRWRRGTQPARRVLAPVLLAALVTALVEAATLAIYAVIGGDVSTASEHPGLVAINRLSVGLIPAGFLIGLLRTRMGDSSVGDLMIGLRASPASGSLKALLSKALGDPSLKVGYWVPALDAYVDASGAPVTLPPSGGQLVLTPVSDHREEPLAVLIHDRALLDDRQRLESVTAAAGLALENERLQATVRAQLQRVRASSARIVAAGDAERARIERDLHDGAQQRLVSLSLALRLLSGRLDLDTHPDAAVRDLARQVAAEIREATNELRELAHGIHPTILTEDGLGAGLQALAERAHLAVELELALAPSARPPAHVEVAAYFICAEALANSVKHSSAGIVRISADQSDQALHVEIVDDGVGGANASRGGGLHGLIDRVEAIGGTLEIRSAPKRGTRIIADIPCTATGDQHSPKIRDNPVGRASLA
jgi:signal transduction histidine kinase